MGFLSKIFGTDPESIKKRVFEGFEQHFAGDFEMTNAAKAGWLTAVGENFGQRSQYNQAIEYFKDAIKLDSNCISAYVSLGLAYVVKEMFKEAIDVLEKADVLEKNIKESKIYTSFKDQPYLLHILNMNLHFPLGIAYMEVGDKEKAIYHFEKSLKAIEEQKNLKEAGGISEQDWEQNKKTMTTSAETAKRLFKQLKQG